MRAMVNGIGCATALLGMGCLCAAWAAAPVAPAATVSPPGHVAAADGAIAGFGPSVDRATLANQSGGSDVIESININGSVSNTSTENVSTGVNWIGGGGFGNAAGLPMVIQNSGNSVLIQNATVINIQMQP